MRETIQKSVKCCWIARFSSWLWLCNIVDILAHHFSFVSFVAFHRSFKFLFASNFLLFSFFQNFHVGLLSLPLFMFLMSNVTPRVSEILPLSDLTTFWTQQKTINVLIKIAWLFPLFEIKSLGPPRALKTIFT